MCTKSSSKPRRRVRLFTAGTTLIAAVLVIGAFPERAEALTELRAGLSLRELAAARGEQRFFSVEVAPGTSELLLEMSGGSGDADLYVRRGAAPGFGTWDYRPYRWGNDETVRVASPASGTWHIMIDAYSSFSGVSLEGHSLGLAATQLGEPQGSARYFAIDVAEGVEELRFEMSGGSGDADLYVRRGAVPTTSSWDYRPYRWGNDETVTIASPAAGRWHVMVRAYTNFSGVGLDFGAFAPELQLYGAAATPIDSVRQWLEAHNKYRCAHGVPPLKWSEDLVRSAQKTIDGNGQGKPFEHGSEPENAAPSWHPAYTPEDIVKDWYDEVKNYNYSTGKQINPKEDIGHFTQVVWKSATEVGCAISKTVKTELHGFVWTGLYVCDYNKGNLVGSFTQNVLPPQRSPAACSPSKIEFDSSGGWVPVASSQCWHIPGHPYYGKDRGTCIDCALLWGASPSVRACGTQAPPIGNLWDWIGGGKTWQGGGLPPGWGSMTAWDLVGYSGQEALRRVSTPYPDLTNILVGSKAACWERVTLQEQGSGHTKTGTGVISCDY